MISPEEKSQRRDHLAQAEHSNRLEGLESSPKFKADAEMWAEGVISWDELHERTLARHTNKNE